MKKMFNRVILLMAMIIVFCGGSMVVMASTASTTAETAVTAEVETEEVTDSTSAKAWAAGIAIATAALGGTLGMAMTVSKAVESIARQPEATSKIQTVMMLGLVFVETAIIYALVIAILIIFVL